MIKVAIGMLGAVGVLVGVLPTPAAAQLKGTAEQRLPAWAMRSLCAAP